MKIMSIRLGEKMHNTGFRGQRTPFVMISKKRNSHELVVPANALWDIWFCDTDSL